mgnify:CR=1 FL=1
MERNAGSTVARACALAVLSTFMMTEVSYGAVVDAAPWAETLHWRTATPDRHVVSWAWPEAANSAKLTVTGLISDETRVFDRETDSWDLLQFQGLARPEDIVSLELEFFGSADATGVALEGETLTAECIGVVSLQGAKIRAIEVNSRKWGRVRDAAVVFAAPIGTTLVTRDGSEELPMSVPGWCGCRMGDVGDSVELALTGDEETFLSTLTYTAGGLILLYR